MTRDIDHQEDNRGGRYTLVEDGETCELTYSRPGEETILIDHTFVPPALRNRGLGEELVARAVADARASERSIVPACSFAAKLFSRRDDWSDVLDRSSV